MIEDADIKKIAEAIRVHPLDGIARVANIVTPFVLLVVGAIGIPWIKWVTESIYLLQPQLRATEAHVELIKVEIKALDLRIIKLERDFDVHISRDSSEYKKP